MDQARGYFEQLVQMLIEYAPKVIGAIVVLLIGMWVIGRLTKWVRKSMDKSGLSLELKNFLASIVRVVMLLLLLFSVAGMVGIQTTSFIAIFGAATLAIGMALQGSLGNFASGVMVMLFRPYKIGDVVEFAGVVGEVMDIQVFNTILKTPQGKTIIVPNSIATSDKITNYTTDGAIRVDTLVNIGYDEDLGKVRKVLLDYLNNNELVLNDPAPNVAVSSYEDYYMKVGVFAFTDPKDYWDTYFKIRNELKGVLGSQGIKVAYPIGMQEGKITA